MTPRLIFSFALVLSVSSARAFDREHEDLRFRGIASNTYGVLTSLGIEEIYPHAAKRARNLCFTDDYYDGGLKGLKLFAALTQKTPAYDTDALKCVKKKPEFLDAFRKKVWKENDRSEEPRFHKAILEQYDLQLTVLAQTIERNIKSSVRSDTPSASTLTLSAGEWKDLAQLEIAPIQMLALKEAARLSQNTSDFAPLDDAVDLVNILLWKNFAPAYAFTKQFLNVLTKFPGSSNYEVANLDPDFFGEHFLDEQRIHTQYKLKLASTSLYTRFVKSSYAGDEQKKQALALAEEFRGNYDHVSSRMYSAALFLALMQARWTNAYRSSLDFSKKLYHDINGYNDEQSSQLFAELFLIDYFLETRIFVERLLRRNENKDSLARLYLLKACVEKKDRSYYPNVTQFLTSYEYGSGVHLSGIDVIATKVSLCASLVNENYQPIFGHGKHVLNNTLLHPRILTEETREAAVTLAKNLFDKKQINAQRLAEITKAMSIED